MKHRTHLSVSYLLFLLAFTPVLFSCKKKENPPEQEKHWLLTINFINDFINPKLKAIVFISDAKGNPLADTMVAGNPRLVLYTEKNVTFPLQVTIAKWEPDMHNFLVTINTYLDVSPSEWTIPGNRLISAGDATFNLQNVPDHSGPILYSNAGYSNLTFATTTLLHPIYHPPDDLYVRLNTLSGPLFKWKIGVVPGVTYDVDLSSMEPAHQHTISLPFSAQDFHVKMYGYRDTSTIYSLPIVTDEQIGNGIKVDSLNVCYPPSAFKSFHTYIEMIESWTSPSTYTYSKDGTIPDSFIKIDASMNDPKPEGSKVTFSGTGRYTVTSAKWNFQDADKLAFDWTVFGSDTLTSITLPSLPPAMLSMFPTLSLDSLRLSQFELIHYPDIKSFPDYLEKSFNPADPGRIIRLESSSVRIPMN